MVDDEGVGVQDEVVLALLLLDCAHAATHLRVHSAIADAMNAVFLSVIVLVVRLLRLQYHFLDVTDSVE